MDIRLGEVLRCWSGVCLCNDFWCWVYNSFVCFLKNVYFMIYIGIIKLVDPPFQVHQYMLPLCLLYKISVSWCLGDLLFHADPSCSHFQFFQQYFLKSLVRACEVAHVLVQFLPGECRYFVCLYPPPRPHVCFFCIWIRIFCIYCMFKSSWGMILDTSVATLATGFGWTVFMMIGPWFDACVYSGSWGG